MTLAQDAADILSQYFERLTRLIGETVLVKCGTVLNWLEVLLLF